MIRKTNYTKISLRGAAVAAAIIFAAGVSAFADVSISASADRTQISLSESVRVSVAISGGGNIPSPQLPDMSNFNAYSAGRSQNISFVNGQMSQSITYTYILSPKNAGKFTLGAFSVTVDGKSYQSDPITIDVAASQPVPSPQNQAGSPPAQANRRQSKSAGAFIKMSVDKSRPYLNEQVILSFRFYYRVPLASNPQYQPPDLAGFIYEDLPPPRHFTETVNGTQYNVTEVKTALFPAQSGRITMQPATLRIRVEDFSADPSSEDFFSSFFGGQAKEYMLKTEPVQLNVQALPQENRPKDFSGGTGEFSIKASIDKNKSSTGEPLTLTVTIEGSGNIKSLSDPAFPPFTGFRKYDTASSLNLDKSKGLVEGSKVYKIILVPQVSGIREIPPISFSYFSLKNGQYKTVTTSPIKLDIAQGKNSGVVVSPSNFAPQGIQEINKEIRYIRLDAPSQKGFRWIAARKLFVLLNIIPVFCLLCAGTYRAKTVLEELHPEKRRKRGAYRAAAKKLKDITHSGKGKAEDNAGKILDAVRDYFADKMGVSNASLTLKSVEEYLARESVPEESITACKSLWDDLELARYAPAQSRSVDEQRMLAQASEVLGKIEWLLRKTGGAQLKTIALLLLFSAVSAATAFSGSLEEKFSEANKQYQEGRFQNALSAYEEIEKNGASGFSLEYNLGNTHYKLGSAGQALSHWIRAWRMRPRDSDVRFNLSFAATQTGEPFFPDFILARWMYDVFYCLNLNELSVLWLIIFWGTLIWWSTVLLRKAKWLTARNIYLLVALLSVFAWWAARFYGEQVRSSGVVIAQKAEVRSGPGKQFGVGFTVPEGRRVILLNQENISGWIEIGIPREGLKGWVTPEAITKI